jgi:glycosyltransferase involved in cell wall biosynthesis
MVPARRWAGQLASLGIRNVVACPWSPMLPATRRSPAGPFRLYVPPVLRPGGDDDTALAVVEAVLARDRGALVAVSTCGRHHAAAKRLDRLARAEPRLTLDRPVDYHRHLLRYGEHSLTLLPAVPENFAMVALCSLHMGTPVVGLDAAPLGELANGENSVLVAGREDLPDAVLGLAGGPALARLFAGCPAGLARRRRDFEAAWAGVLPPAGGPGGRQQDPPEDRG